MTSNENPQMAEPVSPQRLSLLSGRLLARNTVWNLIGSVAPMAVAVFSMPILIRTLGKDRFGVLALAWAVVGYASVFDFGVGRALTQLVARKLGVGEERDVAGLTWTSLLLMFILGVAGAGIVILMAPCLIGRALKLPVDLHDETLRSFYLLGLSIPVVVVTSGLRGLLEAHQCFAISNLLRVPMGVWTFVGPLLVLPFSHNLIFILSTLVAGRFAGCLAYALACLKMVQGLSGGFGLKRAFIRPLLQFGGWMTVTNLVSPVMVTLDRFLIGATLSITAVTYYVTPFEVVTKILVIPAALTGVVFPAFSTSSTRGDGFNVHLLERSIKSVFTAIFPIVLLFVVFAQEGLQVWVGADFAQHSSGVLQIIGIGVFVNSIGSVPFAFLQGIGRPDLTAKLNLLELPLYLLCVWGFTRFRGIEGTALAWTLRMVVDCALLFFISARAVPQTAAGFRRASTSIAVAVAVLCLASLMPGPGSKFCFLFLALAATAVLWRRRISRSAEWLLAQAPVAARREP